MSCLCLAVCLYLFNQYLILPSFKAEEAPRSHLEKAALFDQSDSWKLIQLSRAPHPSQVLQLSRLLKIEAQKLLSADHQGAPSLRYFTLTNLVLDFIGTTVFFLILIMFLRLLHDNYLKVKSQILNGFFTLLESFSLYLGACHSLWWTILFPLACFCS